MLKSIIRKCPDCEVAFSLVGEFVFCPVCKKANPNYSKKQTGEILRLEEDQERLNSQGIIHSMRTTQDLDEAPGAYGDITAVMGAQSDLVKIILELTPLGVVKE